jgi:hypothetical protein
MRRLWSRIFGGETRPVTHLNVRPAPRDFRKEEMIRAHRALTAEEVVAGNRTSWEIRRQLAENVISIVSGGPA